MRKYGVVLALLVVSVAVCVASASAASSPQVFNLLAVSSDNQPPINGFTFDRAPRAGDQFPIWDTLYKWAGTKKGARVGHDQGSGTFQTIGKTSQTTLFTVQVYLGGGTIFVEGMARTVDGPTNLTLPILGGTGKYAGANGYVSVRAIGSSGNNSNLQFHLLR
jgi:hypothetical protein